MMGASHSATRATSRTPPRTTGAVSRTRKTPTIQAETLGTVAVMTWASEFVCTMTTVTPTETMQMAAKILPHRAEPRPFLM